MQTVKAYLRRGTARESLLLYKEAIKGESYDFFTIRLQTVYNSSEDGLFMF